MMLADFMAEVHLELTERQKRMIIDVVQDEVAAEREACAVVAEDYDNLSMKGFVDRYGMGDLPSAIRARNTKESE